MGGAIVDHVGNGGTHESSLGEAIIGVDMGDARGHNLHDTSLSSRTVVVIEIGGTQGTRVSGTIVGMAIGVAHRTMGSDAIADVVIGDVIIVGARRSRVGRGIVGSSTITDSTIGVATVDGGAVVRVAHKAGIGMSTGGSEMLTMSYCAAILNGGALGITVVIGADRARIAISARESERLTVSHCVGALDGDALNVVGTITSDVHRTCEMLVGRHCDRVTR